MRILIVDESPIIHQMMARVLEKNGHEICGNARDGKEGFELYELLDPDIVFMDIKTPVLQSVGSISAIKSRHPEARVAMLVSSQDEHMVRESLTCSSDVFLLKPLNEQKIIDAVKSFA